MTTERRGFTAAEVIVAIAVLALAVLPVFMTTTSGERNVRLTEYHVIAQTRAKRVIEAFATYGLDELRKLGGSGGSLPPPFIDGELDASGMDLPEEYRRKMENFREEYAFENLGPELGRVEVRVFWTISGHEHSYRLARVFGASALSEVPAPPLRQGGG